MKGIKTIFFDLDHTLWDFDANSTATISELYVRFGLAELLKVDFETFMKVYKKINEECWAQYRLGKLTKESLRAIRFSRAFEYFSYSDNQLADDFGWAYIDLCPTKTKLFPNTIVVLEALKEKFDLHIITNGFEETQDIKMKSSGILNFFDKIITSECVGFKKPDSRVFKYALEKTGAEVSSSVMIGDNIKVDCAGAKKIGMNTIWFNPTNQYEEPQSGIWEIQDLTELIEIIQN